MFVTEGGNFLLFFFLFLFLFHRLPLEGLKRKIIRNLRMLESQGVVTIKNDYQDIINAIAKVTFLILFNLTTHTLEMWFVVMLNTVAISLSSKVISFYWFCCLLDYVTDETKPLGNWVTNRAQIIQSVTQAISPCVSVSYLVSCFLVTGHPQSEEIPSKAETRKKETWTNFGKLAEQIAVLWGTNRLL